MRFLMSLFAALLVFCFAGLTEANVPTIAVDELRPGMRGYAKTVIRGTDIETFDVEILGVTGSEFSGQSILIKASGPVLERAGGIAQGMSGSPVYIDGRLAGAIAFGKAFSDPNYCFLTPIGEMLKLLDKPEPMRSVFPPKQTPLMAGGFTPEGVEYLNKKLLPLGLSAVGVPVGKGSLNNVQLEPGSALGVALARGDVELGVLGTVTWTDDQGRILALGHRFMQRGTAQYYLTNAWIFASVPNMQSAFKVGALGDALGRIEEDRSVGVSGRLGKLPNFIPLFVSVTDKDRGQHRTASVRLVANEDLVPSIVDAVCFNAVSKCFDSVDGGTSRISFEITARGDKEGQINLKRENMFYAPKEIAKATNAELIFASEMLMNNKFEKTDVLGINVDVELTTAAEVAEINSVKLPKIKVRAGELLPIEVEFKPFRSEKFTKKIEFRVPRERAAGPMPLIVRGGSALAWARALLKKPQDNKTVPDKERKKDFADFLSDFNKADYNNSLVVDILPKMSRKKAGQSRVSEAAASANPVNSSFSSVFKGTKYKQVYPLSFIADGGIEVVVQVEKNDLE